MAVMDFEEFRRRKLQEKQRQRMDAQKRLLHVPVDEPGKARGLLSHRQRPREASAEEVAPPSGLEKFAPSLEHRVEVSPPAKVQRWERKVLPPEAISRARITSHRVEAPRIDPDDVPKVRGRKRY